MRESRAACVLISGVLVIVGLTACGASVKLTVRREPAPDRALQARLVGAGYTVKGNVGIRGLHPSPTQAFSVNDVDFTTPHTFWVAVYVFRSPAAATLFAKAVGAKLAPTAREFPKPFAAEHKLKLVRAHVYFAFTEMDQSICAYLGLCVDYMNEGAAHCVESVGGLKCTQPPGVPVGDFDKLVATAEGG